MPMTKTMTTLLSVLLLGGTAHARDDGCYGESTVGGAMYEALITTTRGVSSHTNGKVRPPARMFRTVTLSGSRKCVLLRWRPNDKGLYCQIIGKFRKAKDGVPQLTKLKGVKVIDDRSVKSER
jgi:hypothetical protein